MGAQKKSTTRPNAESRATQFLSIRHIAAIVLLVILCLIAGYAHIQVDRIGHDYTGLLAPLDRLFDLLLASALIASAFCIGRMLCRILSFSFDNVAEEISFSVILGTGAIGTSMLALGLLGLLKLAPVVALIILLVAISFREAPRLATAAKEVLSSATATNARVALAILFGLLFVIMLLRAATPPHSFDEAIYHLPVAESFVERGRVYPLIDNAAGNMPFLAQMFYAVCLLAKTDIAAKIFSLLLALVCSLAVYGFCARLLSRRVGLLAMFAFFGAGMIVEVAITTRVDVSLAVMTFMSAYAMILYFEQNQSNWLYLSAAIAGFALATKHTAAIWILLLGVMYLTESFVRKSFPFLTVIKRGLIYVAILLAVVSPWYIKNLVWFNNPLYPFMTGEVVELSGDGPRYFTPDDEPKIEAHFEAARNEIGAIVAQRDQALANAVAQNPINRAPFFWEYFTKPEKYNFPEEYQFPNYLFLLAPLLFRLRKKRWIIWLGVLSVAFYFLVTSQSWYSRYLLPLYPPLTIISVYAIATFSERFADSKGPKMDRIVPVFLVAAMVAVTMFFSVKQMFEVRDLEFVTGKLSRRAFMQSFFYYPPLDYANRNLPADARVMIVGAQMYYDLERDSIADINIDTTSWQRLLVRNASMEDVHNDLKQQRVTHLLVSYNIFPWAAQTRYRYSSFFSGRSSAPNPPYKSPLMNVATLDLYTTKFGEPVYADRMGFILYKLK